MALNFTFCCISNTMWSIFENFRSLHVSYLNKVLHRIAGPHLWICTCICRAGRCNWIDLYHPGGRVSSQGCCGSASADQSSSAFWRKQNRFWLRGAAVGMLSSNFRRGWVIDYGIIKISMGEFGAPVHIPSCPIWGTLIRLAWARVLGFPLGWKSSFGVVAALRIEIILLSRHNCGRWILWCHRELRVETRVKTRSSLARLACSLLGLLYFFVKSWTRFLGSLLWPCLDPWVRVRLG